MTMRKKLLITIACLSVILCTLVSGTIAWLAVKTGEITNTFTPSNITVSLTEENNGTDFKFQMIPGKTYAKDPKVTVETDIPCYVFVKVEENLGTWTGEFATCFTYSVNTESDEWIALDGVAGVYYREVSANGSFYVLSGTGENANGQITVKNTVTKADMELLNATGATMPTLKFTAYACQKEGFADAAAAWAEASK